LSLLEEPKGTNGIDEIGKEEKKAKEIAIEANAELFLEIRDELA